MLRKPVRVFSLFAMVALLAAFAVACGDDDDNGNGDTDPPPTNGDTDNGDADDGEGPGVSLDGEPSQSFTLSMADIVFSEIEFSFGAGELVEFTLENVGEQDHDFVIDEIDAEWRASGGVHQHGDDADIDVEVEPGDSGSLRMIVNSAGEYTFYCSVPGHREAGMEGTLSVQ